MWDHLIEDPARDVDSVVRAIVVPSVSSELIVKGNGFAQNVHVAHRLKPAQPRLHGQAKQREVAAAGAELDVEPQIEFMPPAPKAFSQEGLDLDTTQL